MMLMLTKAIEGRCAVCGEDDHRVLKQFHHQYSKATSPETIILCHNCHDKITHDQNLLPPRARSKQASDAERRAFEDLSIGSLIESIGSHLKKRGLDKHG